ncbi:eukaryotic translation initiation factor 4E-binding protein 1 isoform X2 [Melopsittacus undulatus]|uniref:eukaryotic translation initiation factor 4E-binding protein 1 isoform X2 n=1 Tax=Melopsittacus undulatus TaxID=13146 RepID=UPI00146E2464|nr:eukaryotic translation initiation factor 4E-binding protein 1 isoform X2 [Melopsittacus undulatus]
MSGRCCQGQTPSRDIPTPGKCLTLPDGAPLPPGDYSTTPGGTVFGTTPGGTRMIYDRKFLMECRNSPVAKTPPSDLPDIPGVTSPKVEELKIENNHVQNCDEKASAGEEEQFDMDI